MLIAEPDPSQITDPAWLAREKSRITAKLEGYYLRIRDLAGYLNYLNPFCRLPPEIFQEILLLYRIEHLANHSTELDYADGFYSWISITLVCHRWRQAALETAPLWAHLLLSGNVSTDFAKRILSRSKEAQLAVYISSSSEVELLKLVFVHHERFRSVTLDFEACQRALDENIQLHSMGMLRSLTIYSPYKCEQNGYPAVSGLLGHSFPSLRELSIGWNLFGHLGTLFAPNLTSLHADGMGAGNENMIQGIVSTVTNMPMLEDIVLTLGILPAEPMDMSTLAPSKEPVALSRLRSLSVNDGTPAGCLSLLYRLALPYETKIRLSLDRLPHRDNLLEFSGRCSSSLFGGNGDGIGSPPVFRTCACVKHSQDYCYLFLLWTEELPAEKFSSALPPASFQLDVWVDDLDVPGFVGAAGPQVPLQHITSLSLLSTLAYLTDESILAWSLFLSSMPNVTSLWVGNSTQYPPVVNGTNIRHLLADLRDGSSYVLPRLETLTLTRLEFDPEGASIDAIVGGLKQRRCNHLQLKKVFVERCIRVNRRVLLRLEEIVEDVEWDARVYESIEDSFVRP